MIRRTLITALAGFFLVSCASVDAKQPATVEPIEGFTQASAIIAEPMAEETADSGLSQKRAAIARQHRGPVTALAAIPGTASYFSAGKDGFIAFHAPDGEDDSWQISDIPLKLVAVHPDGNLIAVYETDGFSIHRVSVWDWQTRTRLYAKRFRDSVMSLFWSARGNYLMIGNTSLEGLTVLEGKTGSPVSMFKKAPGIVTLGVTGQTETSMVTFGPAGRILYTDLQAGTERASYSGPQDIAAPVLLRNNLAIAGYLDGNVLLVDATSGKTVSSWASGQPVMATKSADAEPVWLEETPDAAWTLRAGNASSSPFSTPDGSSITVALGLADTIVFGTSSGKICSISPATATTVSQPVPSVAANSEIQAIDDIASDGSRLFLLSKGSVFISSGPGKAPVFAFSGIQGNRFTLFDDSLVFWSNDAPTPVIVAGFDGEKQRILYSPKEEVHSLSLSGSRIALVEGRSGAAVIDVPTGNAVFNYSGAGLQDAVLIDGNRLIVSRSSTSRAPNPVIAINIGTEETVPLQMQGELCYGLKSIPGDGNRLAAFFVKNDSGSSTELVTFTLETGSFSPSQIGVRASYADEDLVATLLVDGGRILTNLGKGSLAGIGLSENKSIRFTRGYALPAKSSVMDQFVVTLNYDGSLTWFERDSGAIVSSSAITEKGLWLEQ